VPRATGSGGALRRHALAALSALCTMLAIAGCASWLPWGDKRPPLPVLVSNDLAPGWSTSIGKSRGNLFVPASAYRGLYAASADGGIHEIADESGRVVARLDARARLRAGVAAGESIIAVADDKGNLLALDDSGRQLWKVEVGGEVVVSPVIALGHVLVRTSDGKLNAYNRLDGKRKWTFQRATPPLTLRTNANLLVHRGVVYAGMPGGRLLALELDSGKPVWESVLSAPRGSTELERIADVAGTPVIEETRICAAVYQGRTGCLETLSGNLVWSRDIGSAGGVAVDFKYLYVTDTDGVVHALDKATGASVWKQDKLAKREPGMPLALRGKVLVGDSEGVVHSILPDDGSLAGRLATDGSRIVSLSIFGDRAIAQTEKGGVFSIIVK
jgi:outer membrane protein assembly factor BamB